MRWDSVGEVVGGNLIVNLLILRYSLSGQMEMLSKQLTVYSLAFRRGVWLRISPKIISVYDINALCGTWCDY